MFHFIQFAYKNIIIITSLRVDIRMRISKSMWVGGIVKRERSWRLFITGFIIVTYSAVNMDTEELEDRVKRRVYLPEDEDEYDVASKPLTGGSLFVLW